MTERVSISLAQLACAIGAELNDSHVADHQVDAVASLPSANEREVSLYTDPSYRQALLESKAAAIILKAADAQLCPVPALIMNNPYLGYARAAQLLNPAPALLPGVHPSAWVSPDAEVHPESSIGPQAVVEANVKIAAGVRVGAGCVIESGVEIGENSEICSRATLCKGTRIGKHCVIHPGAVLGSEGFGLANDQGRWVKVPQLGGVLLGDHVEVGANTTIDRGALEDTVLHDGVKLDNQIQIGHNVIIGENTAIAGCVGIAGSTRIGKRCMIGGGVGIVGHIEIVDDVHITGGSTVLRPIRQAGLYSSGVPLQTNREWHKNYLRFQNLNDMAQRLTRIERKLHTGKPHS